MADTGETLKAGRYRVRAVWRGTVEVEIDDDMTEMDCVDEISTTGDLADWIVERIEP